MTPGGRREPTPGCRILERLGGHQPSLQVVFYWEITAEVAIQFRRKKGERDRGKSNSLRI